MVGGEENLMLDDGAGISLKQTNNTLHNDIIDLSFHVNTADNGHFITGTSNIETD